MGGTTLCFLSILRVSKTSGFHHAAAIFTGALLFPNLFSCTSTNLGKVLQMGFTSAVFTESLPPFISSAPNAQRAETRAAKLLRSLEGAWSLGWGGGWKGFISLKF